jgi:N-acetylmuramoyl-L-alanine amidase
MTDRYRVALTRSDDYQLDIHSRTDMANNLETDLFVSIHAAGSFATAARGICIYYFRDSSVSDLSTGPGMPNNAQEPLLTWDHLQLRHVRISRLLAQSLKERLSPLNQVTVMAAPILVLRGADMPAVLIEIGHLSHTEDAKALRDPAYLESLAVAITDGIDDFFSALKQAKQ